jgi:hypothetical protein
MNQRQVLNDKWHVFAAIIYFYRELWAAFHALKKLYISTAARCNEWEMFILDTHLHSPAQFLISLTTQAILKGVLFVIKNAAFYIK